MPDLGERGTCADKIFVPPALPSILKGYCKAAIRTQPYDLLRWSAAYFRALANDELPPSKERLEFPPCPSPPGLTAGFLKALINQFGKDSALRVKSSVVMNKWNDLCLPPNQLDLILDLLGDEEFRWLNFVAVAAGAISGSLTQTMILLCELLTHDPDGGRASLPVELFLDLYVFLANLDVSPYYFVPELERNSEVSDNEGERKSSATIIASSMSASEIEGEEGEVRLTSRQKTYPKRSLGIGPRLPPEMVAAVEGFMQTSSANQGGLVMPRNIRHWMCPPLDESAFEYTVAY